jgi:SH3 domain-containing YSC84-like protein 1
MNRFVNSAVVGWLACALFTVSAGQTSADQRTSDEIKRVDAAARVLEVVMETPDKGIPEDLLGAAKCVAVVPSMMKGGFLIAEKSGKGVATCRTAKGWSAPAPFTIGAGSWGLQFGGEAVDLLFLVMNEKGMRALQANNLKLGEGSVAAGPVGRQADPATDWNTRSEVLTYSRARGLFTGIELNGAVIKQDDEETRTLYGKMIPFRSILAGKVTPPQGTQSFLSAVQRYAQSPRTKLTGASLEPVSTSGNYGIDQPIMAADGHTSPLSSR